jgi:hypothetical protein
MDRPAALCARRRRRRSRRAAIGCCLHVGVSWLARGKPSAFIQYWNKKISSQNDAAWIDWPAASVSSLDYFLLPSSFDLFSQKKHQEIRSAASTIGSESNSPVTMTARSALLGSHTSCTAPHRTPWNPSISTTTSCNLNQQTYPATKWITSREHHRFSVATKTLSLSLSLSRVSLLGQHKDARNVVWEEFEVQITEGTHDITRLCSSPISTLSSSAC